MRHFLSVSDFGRDEIERVLEIATEIERSWCHCRQMNNKCIASFFAEPSTRTRFSFERAMHWLGGRIVTAADASSSSTWSPYRFEAFLISSRTAMHHHRPAARMAGLNRVSTIRSGLTTLDGRNGRPDPGAP